MMFPKKWYPKMDMENSLKFMVFASTMFGNIIHTIYIYMCVSPGMDVDTVLRLPTLGSSAGDVGVSATGWVGPGKGTTSDSTSWTSTSIGSFFSSQESPKKKVPYALYLYQFAKLITWPLPLQAQFLLLLSLSQSPSQLPQNRHWPTPRTQRSNSSLWPEMAWQLFLPPCAVLVLVNCL